MGIHSAAGIVGQVTFSGSVGIDVDQPQRHSSDRRHALRAEGINAGLLRYFLF
jgi:hypothetical protein